MLYVIDGWFQTQENDGNYTLRGLYVDGLCDAICVFSSSRHNGRPGKSFPHAQAWPRLPRRRDLQCGRRYMEAATLDGQSTKIKKNSLYSSIFE